MAERGMLSACAPAGSCDQGQAALFLDRAQAEDTVRAHAGEDDADRPFLPFLGQRTQEKVDRQAQAARRKGFEQEQATVQQRQVLVRRNHIHAVGGDGHAVFRLDHRHAGEALQQARQRADVQGIEMLDHDEGHAAAGRHVAQEFFERFEASGRAADADDGEVRGGGFHFCGRFAGRLSGARHGANFAGGGG
jgi:hypothetical protein